MTPKPSRPDSWTWWPRNLPRRYGLDPLRDLQVITPMHRGAVGIQTLNLELQERLNPKATAGPGAGGSIATVTR